MNVAIADILSDLDGLETAEDFSRKFEKTFSAFGFNKFTYAGFDSDLLKESSLPNVLSDVIYLTNSDPAWINRYIDEDYSSSGPIMRDCFESRLPIRWTDTYRSNTRTAKEADMMSDAWEHGYKRGLTIPVHGPNGELGVLSLYSDLSDNEFLRATDDSKYDVHLIAHYFHDAVQNKLRQDVAVPMPIALTKRETEILRWTVEGKTAWEIGSILKISERTVNFHIQNVMEKFGVHNKTQAAVKAVGMGVLDA